MYTAKLVDSYADTNEYEIEIKGEAFEVVHTMNKYWFQGTGYATMEAVYAQCAIVEETCPWLF